MASSRLRALSGLIGADDDDDNNDDEAVSGDDRGPIPISDDEPQAHRAALDDAHAQASQSNARMRELYDLGMARHANEPIKWQRRSPELMSKVRAALDKKNQLAKIDKLKEQVAAKDSKLKAVALHFPSIASALQIDLTFTIKEMNEKVKEQAHHFIRLAFMRPSTHDCFGIKPARLRAFAADLALESQLYGLIANALEARQISACQPEPLGVHRHQSRV